MAKQVINTDRVASSASALCIADNNINGAFDTLQKQAKQLNDNWKGAAGTVAQTTMCGLFQYNETRSNVIQNYFNMLQQQVNPGYINAEDVNTKLADKFK